MDAWGEQWHEDIRHAKDFSCRGCGWRWMRAPIEEQYTCVAGWNPRPPSPSRVGNRGMVIIECPICFEKFWFHLDLVCLENAEMMGILAHKAALK